MDAGQAELNRIQKELDGGKKFYSPQERNNYIKEELVVKFLKAKWPLELRVQAEEMVRREWNTIFEPIPPLNVVWSSPVYEVEAQQRAVDETLLFRNLQDRTEHEMEIQTAFAAWKQAHQMGDTHMMQWMQNIYVPWKRESLANPLVNTHRATFIGQFEDSYRNTLGFQQFLQQHALDLYQSQAPVSSSSRPFDGASVRAGVEQTTQAVADVFYPPPPEGSFRPIEVPSDWSPVMLAARLGDVNMTPMRMSPYVDRTGFEESPVRKTFFVPPLSDQFTGPLGGVSLAGDCICAGAMRHAVYDQIRDVLVGSGIYRPCNRWRGSG